MRTIWMPEGAEYGYDVRVNPHLNRMLTSSFTGKTNYMRPLGELHEGRRGDEALRRHDGGVGLPRAKAAPDAEGARRTARDPLGARAAPRLRVHVDRAHREAVGRLPQGATARSRRPSSRDIGDPAKIPLPVDISLSADDRFLFVDSFIDGTVPRLRRRGPAQAEARRASRRSASRSTWSRRAGTGSASTSRRSLLANWDKNRRGRRAVPARFASTARRSRRASRSTSCAAKLGRPHIMNFGLRRVLRRPRGRDAGRRGAMQTLALARPRRLRRASRRPASRPRGRRARATLRAAGTGQLRAPAARSRRAAPAPRQRRSRAELPDSARRGCARLVRVPPLPGRVPAVERGAPARGPRDRGTRRSGIARTHRHREPRPAARPARGDGASPRRARAPERWRFLTAADVGGDRSGARGLRAGRRPQPGGRRRR